MWQSHVEREESSDYIEENQESQPTVRTGPEHITLHKCFYLRLSNCPTQSAGRRVQRPCWTFGFSSGVCCPGHLEGPAPPKGLCFYQRCAVTSSKCFLVSKQSPTFASHTALANHVACPAKQTSCGAEVPQTHRALCTYLAYNILSNNQVMVALSY